MLPNIGFPEMVVIFFIVLLVFGPKSLPKVGQALGKGIREFKDAVHGMSDVINDDPPRPQVSSTPRQSVPTTEQPVLQDSETPKA